MKVDFITSNASKVNLANLRLSKYGIEVKQKSLPLYEIQSINIDEVSKSKAEQAANLTSKPFIIEDSGLIIHSLNGFPGTLLKPVFDSLGDELILKLVGNKSREASVIGQLIFMDPKTGFSKIFNGVCEGRLSNKVTGKYKRGWKVEHIFIPDDEKKTLAQMNDKEWNKFLEKLKKNDQYEKFGRWISRNSIKL